MRSWFGSKGLRNDRLWISYIFTGRWTRRYPYFESWLLDPKTFCHCAGLSNIYHRPFPTPSSPRFLLLDSFLCPAKSHERKGEGYTRKIYSLSLSLSLAFFFLSFLSPSPSFFKDSPTFTFLLARRGKREVVRDEMSTKRSWNMIPLERKNRVI